MTQEQKDRNIRLAEALESGKYTQTHNSLRSDNGFCCLGVACDLVWNEVVSQWEKDSFGTWRFQDDHLVAPMQVSAHYGWENQNPDIEVDGMRNQAAFHNDGNQTVPSKTFHQIAEGFRKLAADSPLEAS